MTGMEIVEVTFELMGGFFPWFMVLAAICLADVIIKILINLVSNTRGIWRD